MCGLWTSSRAQEVPVHRLGGPEAYRPAETAGKRAMLVLPGQEMIWTRRSPPPEAQGPCALKGRSAAPGGTARSLLLPQPALAPAPAHGCSRVPAPRPGAQPLLGRTHLCELWGYSSHPQPHRTAVVTVLTGHMGHPEGTQASFQKGQRGASCDPQEAQLTVGQGGKGDGVQTIAAETKGGVSKMVDCFQALLEETRQHPAPGVFPLHGAPSFTATHPQGPLGPLAETGGPTRMSPGLSCTKAP